MIMKGVMIQKQKRYDKWQVYDSTVEILTLKGPDKP